MSLLLNCGENLYQQIWIEFFLNYKKIIIPFPIRTLHETKKFEILKFTLHNSYNELIGNKKLEWKSFLTLEIFHPSKIVNS